jgi:hypothetical protein
MLIKSPLFIRPETTVFWGTPPTDGTDVAISPGEKYLTGHLFKIQPSQLYGRGYAVCSRDCVNWYMHTSHCHFDDLGHDDIDGTLTVDSQQAPRTSNLPFLTLLSS